MSDPLQLQLAQGISAARPVQTAGVAGTKPVTGDFRSILLNSLDEVNRLQNEAHAGVERLVTGQTDNVAEVLAAVNKADIAFDLLMEVRNKLVDAYEQVQQMRI